MDQNAILEKLKACVMRKFNHSLETPSDFDYLSIKVKKATGEDISATTLKRIFGYIQTESFPRRSSLGVLARYLGYLGWGNFVENAEICSAFVQNDVLLESQLCEGDMVQLEWRPDRKVIIQAMQGKRFQVIESHNAKIQSGDEMTIMMLALNQPRQAFDVIRDGRNIGNYIAGTEGGLTVLKVTEQKEESYNVAVL